MKLIFLPVVGLIGLLSASCSTTTVVKPEPTTVSETNVRRTATTSSYGTMAPVSSSTTTETRSVTAQ
jgi:hypothetical protein